MTKTELKLRDAAERAIAAIEGGEHVGWKEWTHIVNQLKRAVEASKRGEKKDRKP
jgi:hypothetical protein